MGSWERLSLVFKQPPLPMVIYPTCGNVRATGEGGKIPISDSRLVITLLRTFFSSLAVISMSCDRDQSGGGDSRRRDETTIQISLTGYTRSHWSTWGLRYAHFCTHLAGYLLKNSPELLVLLALFPRWGRRRLRRHGATKQKERKKREGEDVKGKTGEKLYFWPVIQHIKSSCVFRNLDYIIRIKEGTKMEGFALISVVFVQENLFNCSDVNWDLYTCC